MPKYFRCSLSLQLTSSMPRPPPQVSSQGSQAHDNFKRKMQEDLEDVGKEKPLAPVGSPPPSDVPERAERAQANLKSTGLRESLIKADVSSEAFFVKSQTNSVKFVFFNQDRTSYDASRYQEPNVENGSVVDCMDRSKKMEEAHRQRQNRVGWQKSTISFVASVIWRYFLFLELSSQRRPSTQTPRTSCWCGRMDKSRRVFWWSISQTSSINPIHE